MPHDKYDEVRGRYRKKYTPYGVRVCAETWDEIMEYEDCTGVEDPGIDEVWVEVETHEGTLRAQFGDWIFEDSQGRHYPIEHEEKERIYEKIDT